MITFKKWLELNGEENRHVAEKLGKAPPYISQLKKQSDLFVNSENTLVRVSKVLDLWEVENDAI